MFLYASIQTWKFEVCGRAQLCNRIEQGTMLSLEKADSVMQVRLSFFENCDHWVCNHWVWLLEWPQAQMRQQNSNFKIEFTRFLVLRSRPTLRSNWPGELAVTWEARLGQSHSRLSSLKNLPIKKHSKLSDF